MRIERLALKNFKCFKEVDVSFSKITLLTGENSSGKSSLINGILSPLQSVNEASYTSFPLYLSLNGSYVNMGGFEDVSFNHNQKIDFGIDLTVSLDKDSTIRLNTFWFFDRLTKSIKLRHLEIKEKSVKAEVKQLEDLSYLVNIERENIINKHLSSIDEVNMFRSHPNRNIEIVKQLEDSSYLVNIENIDTKDFHIQSFDELIGGYGNPSQGYFDTIFENSYINYDAFGYISSFRFQPDRTYYQSLTSNKVDKFGGGYIDQILDWTDTQSKELYDLISILKDLNILYDVKPHKLSGGRFEIKVKVKSRSKWESLADVGFGISQFLPIIVADLQLRDDSTLIMSQPEIHLHPSVQANLGNYLVKQVKERNKNYIVETHSEYLLNRTRLLIVKGEIQPEDVAVYYFENSIKDGSIAHRIEFTKDGQILNAPKGFFETYMIDTMDIALNA